MTPQELKNSILQLAIQGKLVEQRPEEGTGEELFKGLKKYHAGMKCCRDELNYSSMDFDIPDSWKMVELNQLFDFVDYRGKTPNKISEGVFLITASNIKQGYMDYTRKEYISFDEYLGRQSRGITKKGDLLFTTEAPMGNAALCDLDTCSCGQRIITFKPYEDKTVIPALYMYFILSPSFQSQLMDNCTGTTAKGIKADKLKHFLIPIPPLAEQKRIVAKIEELLPLIERYEKAWSRLEDFNKRFPGDMQKSILQMAIQGKLVEQRPEEGTGEELLKKYLCEKEAIDKTGIFKGRKKKTFQPVDYSIVPYELPDNWIWVRLGNLVEIFGRIGFRGYTKQDIVEKGLGAITISPSNIDSSGKTQFDECTYISWEKYEESPEIKIYDGDIILVKTGSSYGKCGIVRCLPEKATINPQLAVLKYILCDVEYLDIVLKSPLARTQFEQFVIGTSIPTFSQEKLSNMLIPLPPLAEQRRIVAQLDELLPLCEKLK